MLKGEIRETRYSLAPNGSSSSDGDDNSEITNALNGSRGANNPAEGSIEPNATTAEKNSGGDGSSLSVSGSKLLEGGGGNGGGGSLVKTSTVTCNPGMVTYIEDSMGLHKMENPSPNEECISLHLYSPGISECTTWADASTCAR